MLDEAMRMARERVGSPWDIDKALRFGLPRGPLGVWYAIGGWAIKAAAQEEAIRELSSEKGRLHQLVNAMVRGRIHRGAG